MRVHRKGVTACLLAGLMGLVSMVHAADSVATPPVKLVLNAPAFAPEQINVTVYLPPGYAVSDARYPVLYANDGQDMDAVGLRDTLATLYAQHAIRPVIVVAVDMLKDRASGYGLFDLARRRSVVGGSRIGPIGTRAYDYSAWVVNELVPYVDTHYRTQASAQGRTMLGWSLGALQAFCLGWEYPDVFGQVGAFSPSFWLATDRSDARAVESTRLAQAMVARSRARKPVRFWFAVGGREETNDRNHNGVIDAVEDLQDLITGFTASDGTHQGGLRDLGYTVDMDYATHPERADDVAYDLFPDGEHNQATWKRMLPVFLTWAYAVEPATQPR
ncbi:MULTISPECIES: alpha/beta hydrolase-fold protein [unclassified Dyella]|uniref:alpha/beta hydrolase n=1 Tax=unclassified Dyella TaxID=2634549 RepID=UPI000CBF3A01|nr:MULTISPECIES: alpha/beta hydrolase-fold protein [unclassified Dyella]MDR3447811.1 alpha/beta hydrolase-fold protein [Dyella sp.]PMQ03504.1 Endo-1,4-beta-xylanase/feruloyl esterase [Dyella sp. AD56]